MTNKISRRCVQDITYQLERKAVKNLNLRVRRDGSVYVSAPPRAAIAQIDNFVSRHSAYIRKAQQQIAQRKQQPPVEYSKEECQKIFSELLEKIYPLVAPLGVARPRLRVRKMTSRWGSCQPVKGIITLNTHLLGAPRPCIEYVILHELCHFLQPNHSRHFYALLEQLMPDWRERKTRLNQTPIAANKKEETPRNTI